MPRRTLRPDEVHADPEAAARAASLRYASPDESGFRRRRAGKGFVYLDVRGKRVTATTHLRRIRALAIPPAWIDVWICRTEDGHVQAAGRDAKGRKQYRYHPRWRAIRDAAKYHHIVRFGESLPRLRARLAEDLTAPGLGKRKVVASAVRVLEETGIRVGNEAYAKQNGSYGLTTLLERHVAVGSQCVEFRFTAKGGKSARVSFCDRKLVRLVKRCMDLPGQRLFQYLDDEGRRAPITSSDVNRYLCETTGSDFTAKEFRTWAATVEAACILAARELPSTQRAVEKAVIEAVDRVAASLGNTRSVCRRCYIHPVVEEAFREGTLGPELSKHRRAAERRPIEGLTRDEAAVLAFLRARTLVEALPVAA